MTDNDDSDVTDEAGADDPADVPTTESTSEADEVAELKAEVQALQAEVEAQHHARGHGVGRKARNGVVGVLVVFTALCFTATSIGVWASRNFLDNDVFAARIGTVIEEQSVQQALARFTTTEVMTLVDVENLIAEALPDSAQILAPVGQRRRVVRGRQGREVFASRVPAVVRDHRRHGANRRSPCSRVRTARSSGRRRFGHPELPAGDRPGARTDR
jgi:hypothetical protein